MKTKNFLIAMMLMLALVFTSCELDEAVAADETAPVITLTGAAAMDVLTTGTYAEPGATAVDDVDGDVDVVITGAVDETTVGDYTITYTATDAAGNVATLPRVVTVIYVDVTAPVITLVGEATVDIIEGSTYSDDGATALDNVDGDITSEIVPTSTVDTDVIAAYTVTYDVADEALNDAVAVVRTVNVLADTVAPEITLVGTDTLNMYTGDAYIDLGATAADNAAGDITSSITVDSSAVDMDNAGSYTVTYDVSDSATTPNAATQVTRTVNVAVMVSDIANAQFLVDALEDNVQTAGVWSSYSGVGSTASIVDEALVFNVLGGDLWSTQLWQAGVAVDAGNFVFEFTASADGDRDILVKIESAGIAPGAFEETISLTTTPTTYKMSMTYFGATGTQSVRPIFALGGSEFEATIDNVVFRQLADSEIAPVITLVGDSSVSITTGDVYADEGATASDNLDGDMGAITAVGTVDTGVAGDYELTYNITDSDGNAATEVTRTVTVADPIIPDAAVLFTISGTEQVLDADFTLGNSGWGANSTIVATDDSAQGYDPAINVLMGTGWGPATDMAINVTAGDLTGKSTLTFKFKSVHNGAGADMMEVQIIGAATQDPGTRLVYDTDGTWDATTYDNGWIEVTRSLDIYGDLSGATSIIFIDKDTVVQNVYFTDIVVE